MTAGADWVVSHFDELRLTLWRHKVAFLGSGAWACAAAKVASKNCERLGVFDPDLTMWVHEEMVNGKLLTQSINEQHENIKVSFLPEKNLNFGTLILLTRFTCSSTFPGLTSAGMSAQSRVRWRR